MTISRRHVLGAIALIVVVLVAAFSPRVLRRLAFFRVRQVEVVGVRYLDESDVVRGLGLRADASTFDDLRPVRAAAAAIPGVVAAEAVRRLPGTLRITVREASPVATADVANRLVLIDSAGKVLPFDPTRDPSTLPIAASDSGVAKLLAHMMRTERALYASVDYARRDRGDVVLDVGPRRIRVRPEADEAVLHAVAAVLYYLNTNTIAWREIDARYQSRVFVQKGST